MARSFTRLGSNATWPAEVAGTACNPSAGVNSVNGLYGDGASRSGFRADPWPVPSNRSFPGLYFRGAASLDAMLDYLLSIGMSQATEIVFSGGSAGGLTSFLHLDHVAERMAREAPKARVVGLPVCGFFLDHDNDGYQPDNVTYTREMAYVYHMQNASGSLSAECQASLAPDSWKCIMAPHAAPFIQTPWFAQQSRFDHWQLSEELFMPCMQAQSYAPPFHPTTCSAKDVANIQAYGPQFMEQFRPLINTPGSKNGAFLDACIIHGSTNSSIDGLTNMEAFNTWWVDEMVCRAGKPGGGRRRSAIAAQIRSCGTSPPTHPNPPGSPAARLGM